MAHYRKPLAAAVALNTAIFVVEAIAGFQAQSLSLIMDSVHNLSDEMALVFLYLAFILPLGVSRNLLRSANVFNSVGLIAVSALLLWQAVERVLNPIPVQGSYSHRDRHCRRTRELGCGAAALEAKPEQCGDPAGLYPQHR
jgi:Co/Zn/Cd efflux system component